MEREKVQERKAFQVHAKCALGALSQFGLARPTFGSVTTGHCAEVAAERETMIETVVYSTFDLSHLEIRAGASSLIFINRPECIVLRVRFL